MNSRKGQVLLELLIAMAVFVLSLSVITFLLLDSFLTEQASRERIKAIFLAQEGQEAARAIRDQSFDSLTPGIFGLAVSGGQWIFQGSEDDVSDQLKNGVRKIIVENIDPDQKKIISKVTWKLTETRPQQVTLVSYLTNWQKFEGQELWGQAAQLLVDVSEAELVGTNKKILRGIDLESNQGDLIIDKIIFVWDNENKIEQLRIANNIVWDKVGPQGSPKGEQPSGTELDVENFKIEEDEEAEIDKVKFSGPMGGATFSITFIMIDESTKTISNISPAP